MTRYLNAPLNFRGRNSGPLCLESHGRKDHSLFSINSRLTKHDNDNINPEIWLEGDESFLIRCTRGHSFIVGFIAVQSRRSRRSTIGEEFKTIVVSNLEGQDSLNRHTTFQLHPKRKWDMLTSEAPRSVNVSLSNNTISEAAPSSNDSD